MSGCTRSNTDGSRVKLYSRPGNDLTDRFPLIVEAPREPSGGLFRCAVGKLLLVHPRQIPRDIDIVVQTACNQGA
jgi:hypothetical protein